ncbi:MAG: hypothetical protein J6L81_01670 [Clostridia bacterium]|nr:hypothetical protein [Clostridia bacterium]
MKRKYIMIAAVLLAIISLFAGCSQESDVQPQTPAPQETLNTELKIIWYDEMTDGQFSKLYPYGQGMEHYVFFCESEMTNAGFFDILYDYDGITGRGETVTVAPVVAKGEGIDVSIDVPEGFPNRGFTYTVGGMTFEYAICYNGRDGGISLVDYNEMVEAQSSTDIDSVFEADIVGAAAQTLFGSYSTIEADGVCTLDGYACNRYRVMTDGTAAAYIAIDSTLMHTFVDMGCTGTYYYTLPDEDGFYYVNLDVPLMPQ